MQARTLAPHATNHGLGELEPRVSTKAILALLLSDQLFVNEQMGTFCLYPFDRIYLLGIRTLNDCHSHDKGFSCY